MQEECRPEQRLQQVEEALPQEPTTVGAEVRATRLPRALVAFRHRNYQLFFGGQIVSLTGTWLQQVALGWLVLQLTNSALLLGIINTISSLPVLLFSLPAGVVADRVNKRDLLIATQISAMVLAFILGLLTYLRIVNFYHIAILGFMLGTVIAFDAPTRQAFVLEMVGREDLTNAIALNSAMFNGARIIGPAIAGLVIGALGIAAAFLLNSASFATVIVGLLLMRIRRYCIARVPATQGMSEGLAFIRSNCLVFSLLSLMCIVSIFSMPYYVLMPVFARDILKIGATGYGYLLSASGIGALIGALTLSLTGTGRKDKLLLAGLGVFCLSLIVFSYSRHVWLSMGLMVTAGWGMMVNIALTNSEIQALTPEHLGGRVMGVYVLVFIGVAPIGSLIAGYLAHWWGTPTAVLIGTVICALGAVAIGPTIIRCSGSLHEGSQETEENIPGNG